MRKINWARRKLMAAIAMTLVCILAMTFAVTASTVGSFEEPFKSDAANLEAYLASYYTEDANANTVYSGKLKEIMDKTSDKGVQGVASTYGTITDPEIKKEIEALAKDVYDRENYRIKMNQMTNSFDISADTSAAGTVLSGFRGLIQTVVGLGAWVVTAGMTLFTVSDFMYITIPIFRNKSQEVAQSNPGMARTDSSSGGSRPKWVTFDAHKAVQKEEETGKNAVGFYLYRRIWAFILIAISLYILITGNINLITGLAINWVSGILSALQNMAG